MKIGKRHITLARKLLLICGFLIPALLFGQVGVGTTTPHPSAMMHIAPGAGSNKGVILPSITSAQRMLLDSTQNLAQGLIFFDKDLQKFYYFHQSPKMWYELDHDWIRKDVAGAGFVVGTNLYSGVPGNVGVGTAATINPAAKLTLVGNASIGNATFTVDSIPPSNSMIVQTWVGIATQTRTPGFELDVNGQARVRRYLTARDSVVSAKFHGEGMATPGSIIMFSGATSGNFVNGLGVGEYTGWALCDGRNSTPDLRGRFVVGRTNTDGNDYVYPNTEKNNIAYRGGTSVGFGVDSVGGLNQVDLTVGTIPLHDHAGSVTNTTGSHSHSLQSPTSCEDMVLAYQGGCTFSRPSQTTSTSSAGSHSHSVTITSEGGGSPHENRPPFYTLSYIMKLP